MREWGHATPAPTLHARQSATFPLPHYNRADAGPVLVYRTNLLPHVRTSRDFSGFVHSMYMCLYNLSLSLIGYDYIQCTCPSVNFFPLQPGGTPREFMVVRDSDDNFSFSANVKSGRAYMMPSTRRNKDVVMKTQDLVAARDSFTIRIDPITPKHKL